MLNVNGLNTELKDREMRSYVYIKQIRVWAKEYVELKFLLLK